MRGKVNLNASRYGAEAAVAASCNGWNGLDVQNSVDDHPQQPDGAVPVDDGQCILGRPAERVGALLTIIEPGIISNVAMNALSAPISLRTKTAESLPAAIDAKLGQGDVPDHSRSRPSISHRRLGSRPTGIGETSCSHSRPRTLFSRLCIALWHSGAIEAAQAGNGNMIDQTYGGAPLSEQ